MATSGALQTLKILSFLATQAGPVPAARIAAAVGAPRSSTFRLLKGMESLGFITHLHETQSYALGIAALEIGQAFAIQEPLARFGIPVLERLVARLGETAHLAVLHGNETLYVCAQTAASRSRLVTAKDVRLPGYLTASGRAILATYTDEQLHALYPTPFAFTRRTDRGPGSMTELRAILETTARNGFAAESGEVTVGLSSLAKNVRDRSGRTVASISVTYVDTTQATPPKGTRKTPSHAAILNSLDQATRELSRRLGWAPAPG